MSEHDDRGIDGVLVGTELTVRKLGTYSLPTSLCHQTSAQLVRLHHMRVPGGIRALTPLAGQLWLRRRGRRVFLRLLCWVLINPIFSFILQLVKGLGLQTLQDLRICSLHLSIASRIGQQGETHLDASRKAWLVN